MKEAIVARVQIADAWIKKRMFESIAARLNAKTRFKPAANRCMISERFKICLKQFVAIQDEDKSALWGTYNFTDYGNII